ncbi:hypothetical protein CMI37_13910 [Candidatus Pacearchaeota archaeon]|nr:hypothetical protein [Candidatus Pacearchaeota archaeon]|tara:strand:- start:1158 stop:1565 length:408 start_codon:yes stop_codon:yes gene_type:complete
MARLAAKVANLSYNSVAIEDELHTIDMSVDVNLPEITAFGDSAKEFVEGLYGATFRVDGYADFAASQGDATIFGQIGSGEAAFDYDPTGTSAGASNPHYTGNALVKSYTVRSEVGAAASYSAELVVNGALTRAVS